MFKFWVPYFHTLFERDASRHDENNFGFILKVRESQGRRKINETILNGRLEYNHFTLYMGTLESHFVSFQMYEIKYINEIKNINACPGLTKIIILFFRLS